MRVSCCSFSVLPLSRPSLLPFSFCAYYYNSSSYFLFVLVNQKLRANELDFPLTATVFAEVASASTQSGRLDIPDVDVDKWHPPFKRRLQR
jgi:hypothetical protein